MKKMKKKNKKKKQNCCLFTFFPSHNASIHAINASKVITTTHIHTRTRWKYTHTFHVSIPMCWSVYTNSCVSRSTLKFCYFLFAVVFYAWNRSFFSLFAYVSFSVCLVCFFFLLLCSFFKAQLYHNDLPMRCCLLTYIRYVDHILYLSLV